MRSKIRTIRELRHKKISWKKISRIESLTLLQAQFYNEQSLELKEPEKFYIELDLKFLKEARNTEIYNGTIKRYLYVISLGFMATVLMLNYCLFLCDRFKSVPMFEQFNDHFNHIGNIFKFCIILDITLLIVILIGIVILKFSKYVSLSLAMGLLTPFKRIITLYLGIIFIEHIIVRKEYHNFDLNMIEDIHRIKSGRICKWFCSYLLIHLKEGKSMVSYLKSGQCDPLLKSYFLESAESKGFYEGLDDIHEILILKLISIIDRLFILFSIKNGIWIMIALAQYFKLIQVPLLLWRTL